MTYQVVITDTAKQDLRDIARWILNESGEKSIAGRFIEELRIKCNRLADFPESGSLPRDYVLRSNGYRFIVHKNYLIFYLIDTDNSRVNVMAIFNGKQDYVKVLKGIL